VLLDGTRLTPSYTNGQIDLNQIPAALIENIEILTGGSSATYGSDAIAGVVNVRLKRNFEGVQLDTQYGQTAESDGETLAVNLVMGGNFSEERGNAVVALSYDDREEIFQGARSFGQFSLGPALTPLGSATINNGRYDSALANRPTQAAIDSVFASYGVPAGAVTAGANLGFNSDGTLFDIAGAENYRGEQFVGFNPASYNFNFAPVNYLQLPLTRRQIAAFGHYEVGDWNTGNAEAYARLVYTTYEASQQLAATPITGLTVPVTNVNIPADMQTILASRPNPTAPFTFRIRTTDVGERIGNNNFDVVQGLVGVRGGFTLGEREWDWDVYGSWGRMENTEQQEGNISFSRIQALLDGEDVGACVASNFNPFGLGNSTPECASAIAIRATNVIEIEQDNFVGSLTGPLFDLPAGPLMAAVGAEYRNVRANFRPDEFLASGDVVGFNAQLPQDGGVNVKEGFAELSVPLLKELPGVNSLDLELGYRYSEYNVAGSVDTYKGALNYRPISTLSFRGSYNRAVRAPSIEDLFLPPQENFPAYQDPCNFNSSFRTGASGAQVAALCQAQGIPAAALATFTQPNPQFRAIQGGNTDLDPESADTYTFGLVWQPQFDAFGLRASVDFWKYELTETLGAVSGNSAVGRCFNDVGANPGFDPSNEWCQLFTRLASGEITDVEETTQNLGALNADGIDVQLDYTVPIGSDWGRLNVNLLVTHINKWEFQEDVVSPFGQFAGTITTDVAEAFPDYKAVLNLGWDWRKFGVNWNMRYIDGMRVVNDDAVGSPVVNGLAPSVPAYDYHRINLRYSPTDNIDLSVGVDNVFDELPPIYTDDVQAGQQANTDPSTYDILGRRYFAMAQFKF
jgi:outer membrane receptor protein involved in Fe transport